MFALLSILSLSADTCQVTYPVSYIEPTQVLLDSSCSYDGQSVETNTSLVYSNSTLVITFKECTFTNILTNKSGPVLSLTKSTNATASFDNCRFTNVGTTHNQGGVIYAKLSDSETKSNVKCNSCSFVKCFASNQGACVYTHTVGYTEVKKCNISEFKASNGEGGAVFCTNKYEGETHLKIIDCKIFKPEINTTALVIKAANFSLVKTDISDCYTTDSNYTGFPTYKATIILDLYVNYCDIDRLNMFNNTHFSLKGSGGHLVFDDDKSMDKLEIIMNQCTFNNTISGSDIVFRTNASVSAIIKGCTFIKNTEQPSIHQVYLKPDALFKGVFNMASTCFYTNVEIKNPSAIYIDFASKNIYFIIDVTNSFDVDSKEKAMNINPVLYGDVFGLHYCKPEGFQGPTPTPVPTNPPATEYCPSFPIDVENTYTIKGCNYIAGSSIMGEIVNKPTIIFEDCSFSNMFNNNGQGGVIQLENINFTQLAVKKCTFTKCGCSGKAGGCIWAENKNIEQGKEVIVEGCKFNYVTAGAKGAALATKVIERVIVRSSTFSNSKVIGQASESGIISILPKGTNGPGYGLVENCFFEQNNRCIASKIYDINVRLCNFSKCYHQNQNSRAEYGYWVGSCIHIPKDAYHTNLLVEMSRFHNVGFVEETKATSCGGAIFNGGINSTTLSNNEFINCLSNKGGAIFVESADGVITISHNLFNQCNGEICINKSCKVVVSSNKFIKSNFRSSFYSIGCQVTFTGNCFNLNYTGKMYGAHYIYLAESSTATIAADNCFDLVEGESVYTYQSKCTAEGSVFSCTQCAEGVGPNIDSSIDGGDKPKSPAGTTTIIAVIVAVIVVVIVVIIVVVVVCKRKGKKDNSDEDNGDYGKVLNEDEVINT